MSGIDSDDEWEDIFDVVPDDKRFAEAEWKEHILDTDARRGFKESVELVNFTDAGGCPVVFRDEAHGGRYKTAVIPSVEADAVLLTLVLHNGKKPIAVPMPIPKKKSYRRQHEILGASMPDIHVSHIWCKPGDTIAFKTREAKRGFVLGGDYGNISQGGEALFKFIATAFVQGVPTTYDASPSFMVRSKRPQVPTGTKRGQHKRLAQLKTDLLSAQKELAMLKEQNMRLRLEESQWNSKLKGIDVSLIPDGPLRAILEHYLGQLPVAVARARV